MTFAAPVRATALVLTVTSSSLFVSNPRSAAVSTDSDLYASPAVVSRSTEKASWSTTRPFDTLDRPCTTPCSPALSSGCRSWRHARMAGAALTSAVPASASSIA